ncbi:TPA: TspO protein [Candidatus Falkowbacteria bacterium]|nr:TspO protein [Candidatus Falkowbacteria bacterium]
MTIKKQPWVILIFSLVITQLAGILGSLFTATKISGWYAGLVRPEITPPGWLFGPVWICLYLLMGVSLFLIIQHKHDNRERQFALRLFYVHLCLNAVWSILFFGLENPLLGLIDIIILWLMIVFVMLRFYPLNQWAAYLLIPYLAWVSYAAVLNFAIFILN